MKTEFNYFWGILGFLGLMGYVLENPIYYVFFAFFLLFLVPLFNKKEKNEENSTQWLENYNLYKLSIWLGSAALMLSGLDNDGYQDHERFSISYPPLRNNGPHN